MLFRSALLRLLLLVAALLAVTLLAVRARAALLAVRLAWTFALWLRNITLPASVVVLWALVVVGLLSCMVLLPKCAVVSRFLSWFFLLFLALIEAIDVLLSSQVERSFIVLLLFAFYERQWLFALAVHFYDLFGTFCGDGFQV